MFGSRVSGKEKEYSDIDLVIIGNKKLDFDTLRLLREAFADSVLPMRVDVLDWHAMSETFRNVILEAGYEVLQRTPDANGTGSIASVGGETQFLHVLTIRSRDVEARRTHSWAVQSNSYHQYDKERRDDIHP